MTVPSVPNELVEVATEAVVQTHREEQMAFLRGEFPANQWRPEQYARAVLSAVSEAGWARAADLAELRLDYESLSASVAKRIRRRDEAIMHAVRLERERDEARAQAEALAEAIETYRVDYFDNVVSATDALDAALRAFRESQEPA